MNELDRNPITTVEKEELINYLRKKLELSQGEYEAILTVQKKTYPDFDGSSLCQKILGKILINSNQLPVYTLSSE